MIKATVYRADGTSEEIPIEVPEDFFATNLDAMHLYRSSGWQLADGEHPQGEGHPGYRVAYKALREMPAGDVTLTSPNVRITFAVGKLERGGVLTPDAVPGRRPSEFVVPEWAERAETVDGVAACSMTSNAAIQFAPWMETVNASYVEFLCILPEGIDADPGSLTRAGRSMVVSLKTMLDVRYGPRLLGVPWTEEIGEVFDDWHWNRRLDSPSISNEIQLALREHSPREFFDELKGQMEFNMALPIDERRRYELASRWYWLADAEPDSVNRFIQFWIVIESLLMSDHGNITPVKTRTAALLGFEDGTADFVGRLYDIRNDLVHGNVPGVADESVLKVETLARLILAGRLGDVSERSEITKIKGWIDAG
jgi:hypothetical protein